MPNKAYKISSDLKKQVLERVKQGETSVPQIASEHGISTKTIYNWLAKGATAPPTWREMTKLKKENKLLHEIIGQLTVKLSSAEKKETGRQYGS